ncbi:YybH family protein [Hyphococcus sp.]|uniref:YybH family protein n=1 Tax=Hyphococcus sp. TaxID=2038636 RepID=UPI00208D12CC|nr:MAG: hypothetical protein DHS20C04_32260 [Marinicaulis sp.]
MRAILFAFAVLALASCDVKTTATAEKARPDFNAALQRHLDAIAVRDLDAFTATITAGDDLNVIFPNGAVLENTNAVVAFHREWFSDDQWRMDPAVVKTIEGADMATALLKYDYRDTPDGAPRSSWLALVFKLERGEWRLVHDQNTRIEPQTELTETESE